MLRWSVLALSVLVNLPVLWDALAAQTVPVETVLVRLVVTVPIVALLLAFVRSASRGPAEPPS
jgi:hypothetical protein